MNIFVWHLNLYFQKLLILFKYQYHVKPENSRINLQVCLQSQFWSLKPKTRFDGNFNFRENLISFVKIVVIQAFASREESK